MRYPNINSQIRNLENMLENRRCRAEEEEVEDQDYRDEVNAQLDKLLVEEGEAWCGGLVAEYKDIMEDTPDWLRAEHLALRAKMEISLKEKSKLDDLDHRLSILVDERLDDYIKAVKDAEINSANFFGNRGNSE